MYKNNDIYKQIIDYKSLTEDEKYKILSPKLIDTSITNYLKQKTNNLYFNIDDEVDGKLFELMCCRKLEGWCWQTTESVIVFLNDNDYIERGVLKLDDKTPFYPHTWICFNFENNLFVLDPSLNILCKKEYYITLFDAKITSKVLAKDVKTELVRQLYEPTSSNKSEAYLSYENFLKTIMGSNYETFIKSKNGRIAIHAPDDPKHPLFRNNVEYEAQIEDGKIIFLNAYYKKNNYKIYK